MTGIFISTSGATVGETIEAMNTITREWTDQAARGECGWICSDCCISFPEGMPDECPHGHQKCTDIIKRDKADAMTPNGKLQPGAEAGEARCSESAASACCAAGNHEGGR